MDKSELRQKIKAELKELSDEQFVTNSQALSAQLVQLISELNSKHGKSALKLGVFSPFQREPKWFVEFDEQDCYFLVVHMHEDSQLSFHPVDLKTLKSEKTSLKLSESYLAVEETPEIILIPGLAFTKTGERLGRGKGYFDRYLEHFQGIKIGICFECQLVADVMSEQHDVVMDFIVTETKIYRRG